MKIAVIGGGAAGFFSAIAAKENYPEADVRIFEKSDKPLAKVKITGGGRCNLTNGCTSSRELSAAYPRGGKALKKAFQQFNTRHTIEWFELRGVPLVTQADNCVFPESQRSQSVINCLRGETKRLEVEIEVGMGIKAIYSHGGGLELHFLKPEIKPRTFDKVIVATGGSPKRKGLEWLEKLGHQIVEPVPSLFTFNMPTETVTRMMGIV
ncbi:MAG: aminoacetone oxidase family FAD-binding enzyme, partial [SAR324 cluster bacterium]|nr:aminoacetone oxidase family FAD-binding enzyme [SAR324 cluster bacterium]